MRMWIVIFLSPRPSRIVKTIKGLTGIFVFGRMRTDGGVLFIRTLIGGCKYMA